MFVFKKFAQCFRQSVTACSSILNASSVSGLNHAAISRAFNTKYTCLSAPVSSKCNFVPQKTSAPYLSSNSFQKRGFYEDNKTKSLAIIDNLKELKSSPLPALALGFGGLIPFVAAPGYLIMSQMYISQVAFAQMTYGASILSFLGGVRWGFAVPEESNLRPDWINLGFSVVPSLIAWVGLLLPDPASLFTVMFGLAGAGYYDMVTWGYPPWFKGLRFLLTFVAVISLWTTFMCKILIKSQDSEETAS